MKKLGITLIPLAATLASLPMTSEASVRTESAKAQTTVAVSSAEAIVPNTILSVGEDLLGFLVTRAEDGTVVAEHASHSSHSSHSSHYSSSR